MKAFMEAIPAEENPGVALKFLEEQHANVARILNLFSPDGRLLSGPVPASCYNDLYKWTMFPVVTTVEKATDNVRCTFSVNIRDAGYRKLLTDSATGKSTPALSEAMKVALADLQNRAFDRSTYERCA